MTLDFRNTNTLWASVLVETLVQLGLEAAVISPGSRSTALTMALAAHPQITAIPVLDERSAAFWGLGLAKRSGRPVVLVCTSGTAGANYYPAVIEAYESQVPLLLLTADRPPELRDCASGQTIDQQKLFGRFVQASIELALPAADLPLLRYLRQTLVQAWQRSRLPVAGPVHLNCPFRDPLAPTADAASATLKTSLEPALGPAFFAHLLPSEALLLPARPSLPRSVSSRGLIIAGPAQPADAKAYCSAIAALSQQLNWPVLAEGLSPLRNHAALLPYLVTTYDAILRQPDWAEALVPSQVIQLGPLPTSKTLRQWLERVEPQTWVIEPSGRNLDPLHGRAVALNLSIEALPAAFTATAADSTYRQTWLTLEARVRQRLDQHFAGLTPLIESKISWLLGHCLPPGTPLVVANSMPVRDIEWFWPPSDRGIQPFFNRGANGIDGTLSTALGVAHGGPPTVLLTGDLALLHDTNGWLTCPRLHGHLSVVLVNNSGGGIFELLPVAQFEPPFETFFAMPPAVDFAQLVSAYGVAHEQISSWSMLERRLSLLPSQGVRVLEVRCDRKVDAPFRQLLLNAVAKFP